MGDIMFYRSTGLFRSGELFLSTKNFFILLITLKSVFVKQSASLSSTALL